MEYEQSLAERFEDIRPHLRSVAGRMLGSAIEADDAVQEAWLRLRRNGVEDVRNLEGWLTTVVARICLDMLRSRKSRREAPLGDEVVDALPGSPERGDPVREALVVDSISFALLVVLESLSPQERVAFVLHDIFAVPYSEIAPIVDRSPEATRQLASRARKRVRGGAQSGGDRAADSRIVEAFLTAARSGDLTTLLELLDPDVVVRADAQALQFGAVAETRGAEAVANKAITRSGPARLALVNGMVGAALAPGGTPYGVLEFAISDGKIIEIFIRADPDRLSQYDVVMLEA